MGQDFRRQTVTSPWRTDPGESAHPIGHNGPRAKILPATRPGHRLSGHEHRATGIPGPGPTAGNGTMCDTPPIP